MSYIGTQPNDVKKNTGLYTPSDILQLTKDGSWGGSLVLIEEQTISSATATIDFTSIQGARFDVHFLTINNYETSTGGNDLVSIRYSNDGGSSYVSSGYQNAYLELNSAGGFSELRSSSESGIRVGYANATEHLNTYVYFYNLNNSSKFSMNTFHGTQENAKGTFGGGCYPVADTVNAIRVFTSQNCDNTTIKLFGVKDII
jgi:hypothetical protein